MRAYRKVDEHYEVRIDGGRLALLGVGAGLVLLLVFLLGVLVGKGLWGGRRPAPLPPAEAVRPAPPADAVGGEARAKPEYTFYDDLKKPGQVAPPTPTEPEAPASGAASGMAETPIPAPKASPAPEAVTEPEARPQTAPAASSPPAPPPAPSAPPAPAKPALPAPVFTVQVGSFRDREAALDLSRRVGAQGVPAQVVQASVAGRTWYRVQVGRFDTRAAAEAHYRNHLRAKGIQGFVTTR